MTTPSPAQTCADEYEEAPARALPSTPPTSLPPGAKPYAPFVREVLAYWAQYMAARFGAPVRLIGSSLHSPTPRDVDIRIVIPDEEFGGRYHVAIEHWQRADVGQAWIDDMAKMNRVLARKGLNADVQVWPESEWNEPYPAPIILAAPSPRWFIRPNAERSE